MKARRVLVDTGAWLAAFHRRDQDHLQAATILRQLRSERTRLVVTDLVLAELHLHLLHGFGCHRAAQHAEAIVSDPLVEEIFVDRELQTAAFDNWIHRFDDQDFTFTDAVSFAVMEAGRMATAFTFDVHFSVAGFRMLPGDVG